MSDSAFFHPGKNCAEVSHADSVVPLIDGAAYFSALREAIKQAQSQVLICGWDFNSQLKLVPDPDDGLPAALGDFLNAVAKRKPRLHIYLLAWDFSLLLAPSREPLPRYRFGWKSHRRVHFELDDKQPVGSSLHTKIAVIDDQIAFTGGLDLTLGRWDTPEHRPTDPRRVDLKGEPARPYHDMQLCLSGEVSRALGDWIRARWQHAGGKPIDPPQPERGSAAPLPGTRASAIKDIDIALARTQPPYEGAPAVREVQQLGLDMIRRARRLIYIENQYFTAPCVGEAIAERLRESDGPEVVVVLPIRTDGWLSRGTMDLLRIRLLLKLRAADEHDRLRAYYPHVPGLEEEFVNVHAKLLLIDDEILRTGSSNFNNRSIGLDYECDVALHAGGREDVQAALADLRHTLLAEHLDTDPETLATTIEQHGSVTRAIDALRGDGRSLRPLPVDAEKNPERWLSQPDILDPEQPVNPDRLIAEFVPRGQQKGARLRLLLLPMILLLALACVGLWKWTPLAAWADVETLRQSAQSLMQPPWGPGIAVGAFVVAGLVAFPVSVLIIVAVLLLGPVTGFICAYIGSQLSALACYSLGYAAGAEPFQRWTGSRINTLSRRLAKRGVLAIIALRIIPVAPFTVINVAAGASHISLRDFTVGTLLGMLPGITAIAIFAERLSAVLSEPSTGTIGTLVLALIVIAAAIYALRRWIEKSDHIDTDEKPHSSTP